MMVPEIRMCQAIVRTHAHDNAALPGKVSVVVTEINGLTGAAGGVVAGIEVQDHMMGRERRREIEDFHICIRQGKKRCGLTHERGFGYAGRF